MNRSLLIALLVLLVIVSSASYKAGVRSVGVEPVVLYRDVDPDHEEALEEAYWAGVNSVVPEQCHILDPDLGLVMGCYEKDKVAETPKGDIYFWRLNDRTRTAFGGWNTSQPGAALILEPEEGGIEKEDILKAYCPNGCWVTGNADPLPEVIKIDENRYAVWAPNDRASSRNGADGRIEILDLRYLSLTPLGKVLTISWWDHPRPLLIGTYQGCRYVVADALEAYDPGYPVMGGYHVVHYPHFQPLDEGCSVYSYDGEVEPDAVVADLKKKFEAMF